MQIPKKNGTLIPIKRFVHSALNGTHFRNGLLPTFDQVLDDLSNPRSGVSEGLTGHLKPDTLHGRPSR